MKAADRYFELYQVHSLPFFHKGIGQFVMIDEPFTYLAVAESRQFFASITRFMLSKCCQELYTVCPSDMTLRAAGEPNCLTALFLGKTDVMFSKCKRLIINETFEPVWISSPDASYRIYSLSVPQRVTVQCQETGSPPTSALTSQMQLKGTGILPNSSFCYIHVENFKLLPHSVRKTAIALTKTHIILPNIDKILQFSEEIVFQSNVDMPTTIQRLNEIQVRATSRSQMKGTEVARIVTALRDVDLPRQPIHWLWFVGMALVFIAIGLLWSMWLRPIQICYQLMQNRATVRHQQTRVTETQRLSSYGNELQVLNQGETTGEVGRGPSPGEDPESPTIPTGFVRHGMVIGESFQ